MTLTEIREGDGSALLNMTVDELRAVEIDVGMGDGMTVGDMWGRIDFRGKLRKEFQDDWTFIWALQVLARVEVEGCHPRENDAHVIVNLHLGGDTLPREHRRLDKTPCGYRWQVLPPQSQNDGAILLYRLSPAIEKILSALTTGRIFSCERCGRYGINKGTKIKRFCGPACRMAVQRRKVLDLKQA